LSLSEKFKMVAPLEFFIKAVKEKVKMTLELGEVVEGAELRSGVKRRYWKSEKAALEKLVYTSQLEKSFFVEPEELLSPAKIEKVLKKNNKKLELEDLVNKISSSKRLFTVYNSN